VAYGAGLRVSKVVALKVGDIDSRRMVIRIEQGKGRKDRYVRCLRICSNCCVPGGGPHDRRAGCFLGAVQPMTTRQLNRACHAAAHVAEIGKPVSMHTLRRYVSFLTMSRTLGFVLGFPANSPVTGDIVLAPSLSLT